MPVININMPETGSVYIAVQIFIHKQEINFPVVTYKQTIIQFNKSNLISPVISMEMEIFL